MGRPKFGALGTVTRARKFETSAGFPPQNSNDVCANLHTQWWPARKSAVSQPEVYPYDLWLTSQKSYGLTYSKLFLVTTGGDIILAGAVGCFLSFLPLANASRRIC